MFELGVMLWKPSPELRLSTSALSGTGVNEVDFVSRERGFFGFIADVKYNKVAASINSPAPVPTFGVIGRA